MISNWPVVISSADSSGVSVRPSAFVRAAVTRVRASPSSDHSSIFMPAAGQPCAVSRTWVLNLAAIFLIRNQITQAKFSDFKDFFKRNLNFLFAGILEARFKTCQDGLLFVQPGTNHKGESKFF